MFAALAYFNTTGPAGASSVAAGASSVAADASSVAGASASVAGADEPQAANTMLNITSKDKTIHFLFIDSPLVFDDFVLSYHSGFAENLQNVRGENRPNEALPSA